MPGPIITWSRSSREGWKVSQKWRHPTGKGQRTSSADVIAGEGSKVNRKWRHSNMADGGHVVWGGKPLISREAKKRSRAQKRDNNRFGIKIFNEEWTGAFYKVLSVSIFTMCHLNCFVNASSSSLSCERMDLACSVIWSLLCSRRLSLSLLTFCRRSSLFSRM